MSQRNIGVQTQLVWGLVTTLIAGSWLLLYILIEHYEVSKFCNCYHKAKKLNSV